MIFGRLTSLESEPEVYEVIDKFTEDGRFYIETIVEIEPGDYIGLEVGDEFVK